MTTENEPSITESTAVSTESTYESAASEATPRQKILIGSQRDPDAYRPKPTIAIVPDEPAATKTGLSQELADPLAESLAQDSSNAAKALKKMTTPPKRGKVELPRLRHGKMSDDLEDEFMAVFAQSSLDDLLEKNAESASHEVLEPDDKIKATVMTLRGDSVFLDLGTREQGLVSLKMFPADATPEPGQILDITVIRFNAEEGLYEVSVPLAAADVRDWYQVQEGMVVEAKITKTNSGGLECEVNRLRGFIPISQIELFRVEDLEVYVGQKMNCVVEEVNPERRNLVLSRRALLNREREEKRAELWAELAVGQEREGLVRKIIDAGAFVDLGGVDGFIPISKLSWGRIHHPSDVLTEGTRVKVRIDRIDNETNRISLVYRDDATNPWALIEQNFQEKTAARGKVTKIMDFGAFVELMPGLEGLIHISELSTKRVNNVREVVKEGEWVDVYVVSIDPESRRIGLSIKQLLQSQAPEVPTADGIEVASEELKPEEKVEPKSDLKIKNPHKGPLKGGTGSSLSSGDQFGLKW